MESFCEGFARALTQSHHRPVSLGATSQLPAPHPTALASSVVSPHIRYPPPGTLATPTAAMLWPTRTRTSTPRNSKPRMCFLVLPCRARTSTQAVCSPSPKRHKCTHAIQHVALGTCVPVQLSTTRLHQVCLHLPRPLCFIRAAGGCSCWAPPTTCSRGAACCRRRTRTTRRWVGPG